MNPETKQVKRLTAEEVFDAVGPAYEDAFAGHPEQAASIKWLIEELEPLKPAVFLDIGCGTGRPVCSELAAAGHDVLGIDISTNMLDAARQRVPNAKFQQIAIGDFAPPKASFDAITVYFSLIADVTQDDIRDYIKRIYDWLKPGGLMVFATVPVAGNKLDINWMGHPVTVSSLTAEDIAESIKAVGFSIFKQEESMFTPKSVEAGLCGPEDVWEEPHVFVYAKKL